MSYEEQIAPLVSAWIPQQRWFAGKGREATIGAAPLTELSTTPAVTIWIAVVDYADGDTETYQVPLVVHETPEHTLEHVLLGSIGTEHGTRWVYDALHDKNATPAWLTGIRDAAPTAERGAVRFVRYAESPDDIPVERESLALTGEQSNTSMVFGDVAIMKVFRRVQPGVNPDIEVQGELSKLGAKHIARLLGAVEADVDGVPSSLAMLQEFLTSATDGWVLATASVRDLMAEADLHAEEAGGDFAGEAERLGAAVAAVHGDLATAFGTRPASTDELRGRAQGMHSRLERALRIVPQLAEVAEGLADTYADVATLRRPVTMQRIHGDLHLGQALRTVYRWVLIDFEGEPMAEIEARREFDSPLRDIAGMLRSFEYAGHHTVTEGGSAAQRMYRANEWSQRNRDAFCDGYAEAAGADPRTSGVLLRAFEADKAVYEAVYEARNRPGWLPIPLASLTRLANPKKAS
jgi:maltokinase